MKELPDTLTVQIEKEDDLVDLIYQPAWKTILLDVVNQEKFDIWNIDIALLAEKYLTRISQLQENNLRIPANAILASAILLKMKSKTICFPSLEAEQENILTPEQIAEMEAMLPDLTSSVKIRKGALSLDELVESIEDVLKLTASKEERFRNRVEFKPEFNLHISEENWDEKISNVFELVKEKVDSQNLVLFSQLTNMHDVIEMINTFIPLLFLSGKNKIYLFQEQFFGEIFVKLIELNNSNISEDTVAEQETDKLN